MSFVQQPAAIRRAKSFDYSAEGPFSNMDEASEVIDKELQRQRHHSNISLAKHLDQVHASSPSLADRSITLIPDPSQVKPTPRPSDSPPVRPTPKFPKPV
ncbi:MAG: hypothetical protein LLG04_17535 [Parachlamydia sp.]|nr:hypothetical protein [Parachlamydia sp.]